MSIKNEIVFLTCFFAHIKNTICVMLNIMGGGKWLKIKDLQ